MDRIVVNDNIILPHNYTIVSPLYHLILVQGNIHFTVDMNTYNLDKPSCIFLSPYQQCVILENSEISLIAFHGDFYCIEYHKKEVACNGILFNNIYSAPFIEIDHSLYQELDSIFKKINIIQDRTEPHEESLIKAYLQVILALSSKEKQKNLTIKSQEIISPYTNFKDLIEKFYIQERSLGFYANYYDTSSENLSKKIKTIFGKPPSILIRERLVLEAKKLLHLTHKNISEIAFDLGFQDEFYFSKYFKKEVGVSPKIYRQNVGISIVAK